MLIFQADYFSSVYLLPNGIIQYRLGEIDIDGASKFQIITSFIEPKMLRKNKQLGETGNYANSDTAGHASWR